MKAVGRSVLAVLVGAIVAMGLISGIETLSSHLYPMPPGVDLHDHETMRQYIHGLPVGAFLLLLAGWAIGSCAGAWVAARIAGRARLLHGLVVGVLFLGASVLTMLMIPHPVWVWIGAIVALAGYSYLGARAAAKPRAMRAAVE